MLGEGVRAAFEHLGQEHKTVCYVEREAPAASQLVALMEAGALDAAPIWSDMLTFDGAAWRGRVDCVIAGFPCQDLSIAGRRAGLNGSRSGLFFRVLDVADDCGAWFLVLENVAGITSATATVMDEAEGELEERAASRVVGELADRGWNAEWITLSASDVGASHGRARWFCFAWRMGGAGLQHQQLQQRHDGAEYSGAGSEFGNTDRKGIHGRGSSGYETGRPKPKIADCELANASSSRQQRHEQRGALRSDRRGSQAHGSTAKLCCTPFFAPSPIFDGWSAIIADHPYLSPATEPGVCGMANGLALVVDESRTHQLRQVGNGVVALCAAVAIVELIHRAQNI